VTIIDGIAERIAAITYDDLPLLAVHWAKMAILDTVGVTLAGAGEPCAQIVERVLAGGGSGECLIFGSDRRAAPLEAALVNGTAAHALDFDDVSNSLGGHPSAPILPALFALAEMLDCDGRAFIAAYVAGSRPRRGSPAASISITTRRAGTRPRPWAFRGDRGVLSSHGPRPEAHRAGARDRRLAGLRHQGQFRHNDKAAACRAHRAQWSFCRPARARGVHRQPGRARAQAGLPPGVQRRGNFDTEAILKDWGNPTTSSAWPRSEAAPVLRQHPSAIDAMLLLRGEHDVAPEKVVRIDSWTHPRRLAHTDRPDPQSGLDAKFSVQYCLARALMGGRIVLEDFEGEAFREPAARALMGLVHAAPHPEMSAAGDEHLGAEVRISFDDGRTIAQRVSSALGRGPDNPLPPDALTGNSPIARPARCRRHKSSKCSK